MPMYGHKYKGVWFLAYIYPPHDPLHKQADKVEHAGLERVHVEAYDRRWEDVEVDPPDIRHAGKRSVLVQDKEGSWLRIWWFESDLVIPKSG